MQEKKIQESILVFDIETIPDINGLYKLELIKEENNDALNEYLKQKKEQTGSDFLPLHLHKVIAISCVLRRNNKEKSEIYIGSLGNLDSSEAQIIQKFYDLIDKYQPQLISWNGSGFDLPVLHYRGLINGVNAYQYWDMGDRKDYNSREYKWNNYVNRYHLRHIDLMEVLAMFQSKLYAKLDDIAKLCNLPGKLGMDGSQVWTQYQQGNLKEIRDYCETDVANTYLVYQKFNSMRYAIPENFEQEKQLLIDNLDDSCPHWREYLVKMAI